MKVTATATAAKDIKAVTNAARNTKAATNAAKNTEAAKDSTNTQVPPDLNSRPETPA